MEIDDFKVDLLKLTNEQVYMKYILGAECFALDLDQHYKVREAISNKYSIEFTDIILVGSGKLGFSLKPKKRFVTFGDDSDIDLAIVSSSLFETVWKEAYLYNKSSADWPQAKTFFKYLSNGWIRPDKLPPSKYFDFTNQWWEFFNQLTSEQICGPYKIRAGLYHSHFFLKQYQLVCIDQCIQETK